VAVVARWKAAGQGRDHRRVSAAERNGSLFVEFIRRNPKVLWGLSNAQLASVVSVIGDCADLAGGYAAVTAPEKAAAAKAALGLFA